MRSLDDTEAELKSDTGAEPAAGAPFRLAAGPAAAVAAMLEARSVALVGASQRPGSLGERMVAQVSASPSRPKLYLVNPRYSEIGGVSCHARLDDVPEPVDLVLLGIPDAALAGQLGVAAGRGDRSAVIFGSAYDVPGQPPGLRARLASIASSAGMALCGAGCMGFVNVARGLRAVGYVEPDPLPAGPVALVTHSGSVFSTMLRSRRGYGFSVAVSSGQELVTTAAAYARYALELPETRVLALVLEAIRDAGPLRAVLADAAAAGLPVVLLAAGGSERGRALVSAHSGALAAGDGAWEALANAYGLHRVGDLAELADTLELFTATSRRTNPHAGTAPALGLGADPGPSASDSEGGVDGCPDGGSGGSWGAGSDLSADGVSGVGVGEVPGGGSGAGLIAGTGIATIHDSGLERAHIADLADQLGVPFAAIGTGTRERLAAVLDPGLEPANPLDMWGTGRDAQQQLTESLTAMAGDPAVAVVALAVDLVPEFDGDESYPQALLAAAARTDVPLAVLASLPASIDPVAATLLRAAGVPVLEGARTGLLALRHLLDQARRAAERATSPEPGAAEPGRPGSPAALGADQVAVPGVGGSAVPGVDQAAMAGVSGANRRVREEASAQTPAGRAVRPGFQAAGPGRSERWANALAGGPLGGAELGELLRDYGIAAVRTRAVASPEAAGEAAGEVGYPVVLKTDMPEVMHKSDVGGVLLGLTDPAALAAAYQDLASRLGPRVLVCQTAAPGTEILLGIATDPALGPLVVAGAGGILAELLADRVVALPPVDRHGALRMLRRLRIYPLLTGARGRPPADLASIVDAITGVSALACELGGSFGALDINPVICGPAGAVAVDALIL